jgi:hypothetical protein
MTGERNRQPTEPLVLALLFYTLMETINTLFFTKHPDPYFYSRADQIRLFRPGFIEIKKRSFGCPVGLCKCVFFSPIIILLKKKIM